MSENLAVNILREKEKEYESFLSDIRLSIKILLNANGTYTNDIKTIDSNGSSISHKGDGQANQKQETGKSLDSILNRLDELLQREGRFLHKREIEKMGIESPSAILSDAKKKGKRGITSYQPGISKNQTVWGFSKWLDQDGKPKHEHMFNEKFVLSIK